MLVAAETLADLKLAEGATPQANDGTMLPPLRVQPQLVPRRAGGRYRHRAATPEHAGPGVAPADRQGQGAARAAGKRRGRQAAPVEPEAATDLERLTDSFHLNLTAFGLLSFFVGLFIVNSAIGLAFEQRLPMLRTLRACGVSARMLNTVLVIEQVTLAIVAGLAGLVCGYFIAAALLPDVAASLRGLYGAQIPGQLVLKREWWLAGIGISVLGALGRGGREPDQGDPPAGAGLRTAASLATGAGALAEMAERRGAARLRRSPALLIWLGDSLLAGFAVLAALLLGAALLLPASARTRAVARRARAQHRRCQLVLCRQPPAIVRPVAGADGAVAGAGRQCRRRHHGGKL